jgi:hypothetical protein
LIENPVLARIPCRIISGLYANIIVAKRIVFRKEIMTTIERTAYPRFKSAFTQDELAHFYNPTESDAVFVENRAIDETHQLAMMILLKAFQKLGYLPRLDDVPVSVGKHIARQMQRSWPDQLHDLPRMTRSRYRQAIYTHLDIKAFRDGGDHFKPCASLSVPLASSYLLTIIESCQNLTQLTPIPDTNSASGF